MTNIISALATSPWHLSKKMTSVAYMSSLSVHWTMTYCTSYSCFLDIVFCGFFSIFPAPTILVLTNYFSIFLRSFLLLAFDSSTCHCFQKPDQQFMIHKTFDQLVSISSRWVRELLASSFSELSQLPLHRTAQIWPDLMKSLPRRAWNVVQIMASEMHVAPWIFSMTKHPLLAFELFVLGPKTYVSVLRGVTQKTFLRCLSFFIDF